MDAYCRCDGYWDPVSQAIVRVDCSRCTLPGHVETEKEEEVGLVQG
ncbi:hypothetical protein M2390_003141 [Mycetocola sp. BIGb0189]|nr:hypothetical protein [Mycetocola sp. BIGb0189]